MKLLKYDEFVNIWKGIKNTDFANDKENLFTGVIGRVSLIDIYENHLYKHRNRCAHNTQSYQQNLPTLKNLVNENYQYENYFVWFSILVLIDKLFIALYVKYLDALQDD